MTDNTKYFQMIERTIKAGAKRAGDSDEIDLAHFASIQKLAEEQLRVAVHIQLDEGKSFTDIGLALGISRQAAQRRFKR